MTNHRGIMHYTVKGAPLCGRRDAIEGSSPEEFRAAPARQCKRCAAKLAKMQALINRRITSLREI